MRKLKQKGASLRWMARLFLALSVVAPACKSKGPRTVPDELAQPVVAPVSARTHLALTIYSRGDGAPGGYAFVREERKVRLPAGRFVLSAPEIASDVVPETTRFQLISTDDDGNRQSAAELYEQRYLFDRLTPDRVMEKSDGQPVRVVWWAGHRKGHERSQTGKVVFTKDGVMIRLDSGALMPIDRGRMYLAALPPDLMTEPTLKWNVGSFEAANAILKLSYRANRFGWSADYVVNLDKGGTAADVEGWVTVVNEGDTAFEQAKLQLVAGAVHTADVSPPEMAQEAFASDMRFLDEAPRVRAQEETLGDLHLYTIEHPTTLPAKSSKQVRFVLAHGVEVKLEAETTVDLELGEGGDFPAALQARLDHDKKGPLHMPLPAGIVRTNMPARSGTPIQVGEGSVEHTPAGEPWRIPIGADANQRTRLRFDDDKHLGRGHGGERVTRHTITVQLRNASDAPRFRRVILNPGRFLRFVALPEAGGAKLEGPKRIVLESELGGGQTRSFKLVVDIAEPNSATDRNLMPFPVRGPLDDAVAP